jgi:DNA-binding CsgD family transcriptional regulator/PAS domain-containing protein
MDRLFRLEQIWEDRNRTTVGIVSGAIIAAIALVDWWTKPYVSLGFLYLFPIMFVAAFVPRGVVVLLAAGCAILAEVFSSLEPSLVRLGFEALALAGSGLFVAELVRNRRLTQQAEARLKALVETSPAAIVTVDKSGFIELANQSAIELMAPRDGKLAGAPIAAFLPELHHALRLEEPPQFRTSMQCYGHKGNEESFTADVWFSTYKEGASVKLAAIIANTTDEAPAAAAAASSAPAKDREQVAMNAMALNAIALNPIALNPIALNDRESGVLRLLIEGLANKEIAARMEVSESTIKNTLQQLFAKTNVRTRAQLVCVAFELYRDDLADSKSPVLRSRGLGSEARRMLSAGYGSRRAGENAYSA